MGGIDLPTMQALLGHKETAMMLLCTHLATDCKQYVVHVPEDFGEYFLNFS
jgi:hypothetical protein